MENQVFLGSLKPLQSKNAMHLIVLKYNLENGGTLSGVEVQSCHLFKILINSWFLIFYLIN